MWFPQLLHTMRMSVCASLCFQATTFVASTFFATSHCYAIGKLCFALRHPGIDCDVFVPIDMILCHVHTFIHLYAGKVGLSLLHVDNYCGHMVKVRRFRACIFDNMSWTYAYTYILLCIYIYIYIYTYILARQTVLPWLQFAHLFMEGFEPKMQYCSCDFGESRQALQASTFR